MTTTTTTSSTTTSSLSLSTKLDSYFLISERGSTIGNEIRAGTTSFLTLSYLLLVNPQIMSQAGVATEDALLATALSGSLASIMVGLAANLPFGCAPGIGLSAYLAYGLVVAELCSLEEALVVCFWSGIVVIAIAVCGLTSLLMKIVPQSIKYGIVVGMGLLIAMIGMVDVDLIVANPKTLVQLGSVYEDPSLILCLCGILLVASLLYHNIKGSILIGITILTLISWFMNNAWPQTFVQWPTFHNNEFVNADNIWIVFDSAKSGIFLPALASFVLICIFDISGVIYGLATLGGLLMRQQQPDDTYTEIIPGSSWTFIASGIGTIVAAFLGSTPIIVCVETASGVREGGKTGLTAVVVGVYFASSIFLAPLFSAVPNVATSPVLVMVGVMMMNEAAKIKWENMNEALPAFLTIILMPLTYSITNGMIFGLLSAAGFYITTGQMFMDANTITHKATQACRPTNSTGASETAEGEAAPGQNGETKNLLQTDYAESSGRTTTSSYESIDGAQP